MSALAIFAPRRFARLIAADAANVVRDPMLILAIVMSLAPSIALSFGRELLDAEALARVAIADVSRYVIPFVLLIPALLIGWVTGMLLLEDRDDGPLLAIDVTPIGKRGFLAYRVTVTALAAAAVTVFALWLILPGVAWPMAVLLAALVAMEAVCMAAVLPAIARNKVEGLALTKLANLATLAPLIAVLPTCWRLIAGIIPSYWFGELLGLTPVPCLPAGAIVALSLASHAALAAGLFWLLGRRIG